MANEVFQDKLNKVVRFDAATSVGIRGAWLNLITAGSSALGKSLVLWRLSSIMVIKRYQRSDISTGGQESVEDTPEPKLKAWKNWRLITTVMHLHALIEKQNRN